jgi:hypothetical protein
MMGNEESGSGLSIPSRPSPSVRRKRLQDLFTRLEEIYADLDLIHGPEGPIPVAILPPAPETENDPDRLLGSLSRRILDPFVSKPGVVPVLNRAGGPFWDGRTFSLDRLEADREGRIKTLHGRLGSYFSMLASAGYLEWEALSAVSGQRWGASDLRMPERERLLFRYGTSGECLMQGGGVDAAIAVSTLVVYARDKRFWCLAEKRRRFATVYGPRIHVVPAFMMQPLTGTSFASIKKEWSVRHNLIREYLEELFAYPETDDGGSLQETERMVNHPNWLFLSGMMDRGRAGLHLLGLAFNLLSHRPEILTLLLIEDEEWYRIQTDRELALKRGLERLVTGTGQRTRLLDSENLPDVIPFAIDDDRWRERLRPWNVLPQAAAALILGVRRASELLGLPAPGWTGMFR